jgi:hypothetical protein
MVTLKRVSFCTREERKSTVEITTQNVWTDWINSLLKCMVLFTFLYTYIGSTSGGIFFLSLIFLTYFYGKIIYLYLFFIHLLIFFFPILTYFCRSFALSIWSFRWSSGYKRQRRNSSANTPWSPTGTLCEI